MSGILRQTCIRYIIAATCLPVTVVGNSDMVVLCIGEDGHMAVEAVSSNCCGSFPVSVSERGVGVFAADGRSANGEDCGSCVDIPLSAGAVGSLSMGKKINLSFPAATAVISLSAAAAQISELKSALKSFELFPFFTPLRSVILLT
ncbi:MAG: hypothetical protein ACYTEQ_08580 [Planctomycetota bacterium]|jgi:hypothetical protein